MSFDRTRLPDPMGYYEAQGLKFRECRGTWRTTECRFHGGSDSLRVNIQTGAFVCMAGCGARGGDVLAYEMAITGADFTTAARTLGAWVDDGKPAPTKPSPFTARDALEVLRAEAVLVAVAAGTLAQGGVLADSDRKRLLMAADRVQTIVEVA